MLFGVIYTINCHKKVRLHGEPWNYPPRWKKLWSITETNDEYVDEHLTLKHRKMCAVLTKEQFIDFVHHCYLYSEDVETGGALGAPGLGFGLSPAISFEGDNDKYSRNAYVTPIPEPAGWPDDKPFSERDWERLRRVVIDAFDSMGGSLAA